MSKLSFYNLKAKIPGGGCVLYNSLNRNIVELNKMETSQYAEMELSGVTECALAEELYKLNFIVDDDFDEVEYYKLLWFRSLYSSGILRHTILPNLACNCDCPYCFENKNGQFMTQATADSYLNWLESQLGGISKFYVSWFGGEPLLSKNMISYITHGILELARTYHFEYSSCVVTNGVLLDKDFVSKADSLHIDSVQITLDGDRATHNKFRYLRGSHAGTFDTIVSNLSEFCKTSKSDVASILRVNVTDENYDTMSTLFQQLPLAIKSRCAVIFRWVYSHNEGRNPGMEFSGQKKGTAPYANLAPLYQLAQQHGFITNSFDEGMNCSFCECDFDHALQIDQDGDLFMCTHSMNKAEVVGNVKDGFSNQRNISRYAKFVNTNPFDDAECINCNILPICKGGCRKARYLGEKVCSDIKYSPQAYVLEKARKAMSLEL